MDHDRPQTASSSGLPASHPEARTQTGLPPSEPHPHGDPAIGPVFITAGPRQETSSPTPWLDEKDERNTDEATSPKPPSSPPLPPLPDEISPRGILHPDPRTIPPTLGRLSLGPSGGDWIAPREERAGRRKSVGERLDPTLLTAIAEKEKYALKAKMTGFALNAAIALQVLLGTLTTGLAVVISGRKAQLTTAMLGGFSTVVASYLARARGSNEPELSITRVKDLEQFIRDCEAFKMDHGHVADDTLDDKLFDFRERFEDLLGNASGQRKLSA